MLARAGASRAFRVMTSARVSASSVAAEPDSNIGNWALVEFVETLDEVGARYAAILCDVWGVVHNGVEPFPKRPQR